MKMQDAATAPVQSRPFVVNARMLLGLAAPMMLVYLTTPLLGIADTAVVGRLGDAALVGGLAVGSVIIDLIFVTFNFQRSGTTGLTAQALGAADEVEKQAILFRALALAALAGAAIIAVAPLAMAVALYFMAPGEAVAAAARDYFNIRILSAPLVLANYAILGWLIGLGRSGLALALQVWLNGLNIVLSVALGLWLGYGLPGVAWATVIAEVMAALAGLAICRPMLPAAWRPARIRIFDAVALRRLVSLNGDIMVRSFALLFAFAFFTAQGSRFGEVTLAANAVLMQFFILGGYFLDGLATAAEQVVGRAIGARHRAALVDGIRLSTLINFALALALSAILYGFGNLLVALLTTIESVRAEAADYLPLAALTPLTGVLAFQMDGVFIGATWSRDMSRMMVASLAIFVAAWWLMREPLGNTGLWLALHAFLVARGLLLAAMLRPRIARVFA